MNKNIPITCPKSYYGTLLMGVTFFGEPSKEIKRNNGLRKLLFTDLLRQLKHIRLVAFPCLIPNFVKSRSW